MAAAPPRRGPPAARKGARLLMTADAVGGVWTYALDLAAGLARADVETTLAVLGPSPSAAQLAAAQAVPGLTVVDTGLPLDWTAGSLAEIGAAGAAVAELAAASRADLIQLNSPTLAAGGGFPVPVVGACHSCLATWWSAVKDGPMPPDFRWRSQALWRGLLACDALIAPTRAFAEAVSRAYEVQAPEVVWNGRAPASAGLRGPREAMVFTSGRLWDEGKNVAVLDAAAAALDAPLYAAGPLEGPNGARVELRHAQALGRLSADEVADWLPRAPVFATTALYEPFGLGVLEAAQAGCALVLSDIETLRELWDGAAVFVDPRDPGRVAAVLRLLLADEAEREALARQARARSARYSADAMAAGALDVYRRFCAELPLLHPREAAA